MQELIERIRSGPAPIEPAALDDAMQELADSLLELERQIDEPISKSGVELDWRDAVPEASWPELPADDPVEPHEVAVGSVLEELIWVACGGAALGELRRASSPKVSAAVAASSRVGKALAARMNGVL